MGWSRRRVREVEPTAEGGVPVAAAILTIQSEAVQGQGEDSDPLAVQGPDGSLLLAVFDGLGGAGGARYQVDGVERKGAYLASRLARRVTWEVGAGLLAAGRAMWSDFGKEEGMANFVRILHGRLQREFEAAAANLGGEPSQLRSAMVRDLPTTAAIAIVEPPPLDPAARSRRGWAIWAGDSRIYSLGAGGLAQISRDDARGGADAYTSLTTDPPIDNCISASEPFELRLVEWEVEVPSVVLAATDGCFGYFPTPAHFEMVLLDAFTASASLQDCQARLAGRISAAARDDATLAAAVLGGGDPGDFQARLKGRLAHLEKAFVNPYDWQQGQVRQAAEALEFATARHEAGVEELDRCAAELWEHYRADYERFLAVDPPRSTDPEQR